MTARRNASGVLLVVVIVTMVIAVAGFLISLVVNTFVMDRYDAYGEVPIPGSGSLHLPAGDVTVSFHTQTIGSPSGSGLPIPELTVGIDPPRGAPAVQLTENIGGTTSVNNDTRRRIWVAQIPQEGTYRITTDGRVSAFINPTLAFGHTSSLGWLPWVFVALFGSGVLGLVISIVWRRRVKISPPQWSVAPGPPPGPRARPAGPEAATGPTAAEVRVQPADPYTLTDAGIRIEALKHLVELRDSGALSQREFEDEKRRILDGR